MTMRSSVVLLLAVIYVYSRPLAAYADVRRYVLYVFLAAIFPQTINRPNFFLSIQHRWQRRTYFFNHYNVLFFNTFPFIKYYMQSGICLSFTTGHFTSVYFANIIFPFNSSTSPYYDKRLPSTDSKISWCENVTRSKRARIK